MLLRQQEQAFDQKCASSLTKPFPKVIGTFKGMQILTVYKLLKKVGWSNKGYQPYIPNNSSWWKIMRLSFIFLLATGLSVSAESFSQITLQEKNVPLVSVLRKVKKQSGMDVLYPYNLIQQAGRVSVNVKNASVEETLRQLLINTNLAFAVHGSTIVIRAKPTPKAPVEVTDWQVINVKGRILDENGVPVEASVQVKGQTKGTLSNSEGYFELTDVEDDAILIISGVHIETKEVPVAGQMELKDIVVQSKIVEAAEIVVGYATQKKANMTGAVSAISAQQLADRPVTNVSSALAGLAAGVQVRQGSGKPGNDGATIRIRGTGTLNSNAASPLVVIDGIIGVMDAVNPNDIENISILKDAASASIYGAQAANGVILITTKKGKGRAPQIDYTGIASINSYGRYVTFVSDYVRHMELYNEGAFNMNQNLPYSQVSIDKWRAAQQNPNELNAHGIPNYVAYPNTDWASAIFERNIVNNHNLSVRGATENINYNVSARILDNPGLMANTGAKRYEMRANLEAKVASFITMGTQTFASTETIQRGNSEAGSLGVFNYLRQTTPGLYPLYEGRFGAPTSSDESPGLNNLLTLLYGNDGKNQTSRLNTSLYANVDIIRGLRFETKVNYQTRMQEQTAYAVPIERWDFENNQVLVPLPANNALTTSQSFNKNYTVTFDNVIRYNTSFGRHDIGVMAGHNEWYYNYYTFGASQIGLIDANITNIGSGTEMATISGEEYDRSMRSFFGRINYAFDSKYLLEANIRRDGSSRFGSDRRWGTYPSFSVGWRFTEEGFLAGLSNYITNGKVRASWGRLGNDAAGNYDWQATYGGVNYSFGGNQITGLRQGKMGNPFLQWESVEQTDIGLEFSTLKNRLSVEFDYYNRLTYGILTTPPIPLTAGTISGPTVNTADMLNRGIELSMSWRDKIGNVNYQIGGNISYNRNTVKKFRGTLQEGWTKDADGNDVWMTNLSSVSADANAITQTLEGYGLGEYYIRKLYAGDATYTNADGSVNINGGPKDGMIRTEDDLAWVNAMKDAGYTFSPVNNVSKTQLYYGDFIYADLNGDKIYGNANDRYFTGTRAEPLYTYGFNLAASWKGFDISMIWNGAAGMQYYWNAAVSNNSVLIAGNAVANHIADNHYFYNDTDPNDARTKLDGKFPRLKYGTDNVNNAANNFWLYNASYLKLRNLQIGYTFPASLTERAKIRNARLFFTGENLILITRYPGVDPELGAGFGYPTMRQFSLGLNLGF